MNVIASSISTDGMTLIEWLITPEEVLCLVRGGHVRFWVDSDSRAPIQQVCLEVVQPLHEVKES